MPKRTPEQHSKEIFTELDYPIAISFGDTPGIDAFGRQRVAEPESLFDSSFEYDLQPFFWNQITTGNGTITHDTTAKLASLNVGAGTGTAAIQTYEYFPYQKGKSQRLLATFVFGAAKVGITRRVGYFDASDGVYFEQTSAGLFLVVRSSTGGSVVNSRTAQASWSQDDLTGSKDQEANPSEIRLDITKRQILDLDIEWLGVGRVRYGFNIDGMTIYADFVNHANMGDPRPYMRTGTLPIRYEISNDGSGQAATLLAICTSIFSEGGFDTGRGVPFSANNGAVARSIGAARIPILSIRPKSTFGGFTNRVQIRPQAMSILAATQSVLVEVIYNGLLFGTGSFVSANSQSAVEYNTSFTIISGGYVAQSFYASTNGVGVNARGGVASPILSRLPLTLDAAGANPIPLSIVCTPLAATPTVVASIDWTEVR